MFDFSLQRDRLYQQVADRIQHLIAEDALRPGDKLPGERELAERMGVSRTVVREAIRALSVRGLVRVKSGCGTYVQELSPRDVAAHIELFLKLRQTTEPYRDIYEIRRMIEVEAAGLAATRAAESDCEAMEAAIEGMAASVEDRERYIEHDLAFHAALAAATHNELFNVLLSPISDLLQEFILVSVYAPGAFEDGLNHHRKILTQVRRGHPADAQTAMRDHLDHAQKMVEAVRTQMETPEDVREES
jgi:GntR family transcriptional repressor for pyruvate dehydrogenase complex